MEKIYWTVRELEVDGSDFRPIAGVWPDDSYGEQAARDFAEKMDMIPVRIVIKEA